MLVISYVVDDYASKSMSLVTLMLATYAVVGMACSSVPASM